MNNKLFIISNEYWSVSVSCISTPNTGSECCQESRGNSFNTVLEALTKAVLLSIQNLVKTNTTEETREEETEEEQNKEDIDQRFQEGLLKKHLSEGIDIQLELFNIPKVNLNVLTLHVCQRNNY